MEKPTKSQDHSLKKETRWVRRPEERPDAILDGALLEFKNSGFTKARIEDIAKHAGLSKGTVYLYFKSKEDMLVALIKRSVKPIAEKINDISKLKQSDLNQYSAIDSLQMMLNVMAQKLTDPKVTAIPILIISEARNFPNLAEIYREEVIKIGMAAFSNVIKRGMKTGEFRQMNVQYTVRSLLGIIPLQIIWINVFARPGDPAPNFKDMIKNHLDLFLHGISNSGGTIK